MKHYFNYKIDGGKISPVYSIPEDVVDFKVVKESNGVFLQYIMKDEKKRNWATFIIGKNFRRIDHFYFDESLKVSFVQLSDGRLGFSRCSRDDKFDTVIEKAVAICHATGEEIPDFIKN